MYYILIGSNIDDKVPSTSLNIPTTELDNFEVGGRVKYIHSFLNNNNIDFTDKFVFLWSAPSNVDLSTYKYNTLDFTLISTPESRRVAKSVVDESCEVEELWISETTRQHLMAFGAKFFK